jgi:hypothetical protein|tara:strand:- start:1919 stop:2242 length:324 start_codon:yes stop_codon:yes gene_type:complete
MIKSITESLDGDKLSVEVECKIRKFATHSIILLTTSNLRDILSKKYKILNVLKEPKHKVGNTQRHKIQLSGEWLFQIEKEEPRKPRSSSSTKKKSIRSRMSALAKQD